MKISIAYVSNTNTTKEIAECFKQNFIQRGIEVYLSDIKNVDFETFLNADIFFLGSPACGVEQIDKNHMIPFITKINKKIKNKNVFLFGSYGWGGGVFIKDFKNFLNDVNIIGEFTNLEHPTTKTKEKIEEIVKKIIKNFINKKE